MKSAITLASLLLLISSWALGQTYCEIGTPENACVGQNVYFYTGCETATVGAWYIDGVSVSSQNDFVHVFTQPGTHEITVSFTTGELANPKSINVYNSPDVPTIQADKNVLCDNDQGDDVHLWVTNVQPGVTYQWTAPGLTATGPDVTFNNLAQSTQFMVTAEIGGCAANAAIYIELAHTLVQPLVQSAMPYHKRAVYGSENHTQHFWQTSPQGTSTASVVAGDYFVTEPGQYYIRRGLGSCWTQASSPVQVAINYTPPQPVVIEIKKQGYNEVVLNVDDKTHVLTYADYYWVSGATGTETNKKFFDHDKLFQDGTYYLRGRDKGTGTWGTALTLTTQLRGDEGLNWIHTKSFDGNATVVAESKGYFDEAGKSLQSQVKNIEANIVLATQDLCDRYGRVVGGTLAAPIKQTSFFYNPMFVTNVSGQVYDHLDFDAASTIYNPNAVSHDTEGTLGWYYRTGNPDNIAATDYPYSRTEFYTDGTGEAKRGAGPGNEHRLGKDHDVLSGTFPVYNELNDYLVKRRLAFPGLTDDNSLTNEGVQSVARDQNGKYAVSITDKSGKTVMSARKGTSTDKVLSVTSTITAQVTDASAANYRPMTYFYILDAQSIAITATNATYTIEDIVAGAAYTPPPADGEWKVGFYRIILTQGSISFSYTNHFLDVAYQFYDDGGKLKASLSPNGYVQLGDTNGKIYDEEDPAYPLDPKPAVDLTWYKYNFRGWLLTMKEPDAGTTKYIYRKDGKIRFSQNAQQKNDHRFSYTHYDALGRPVESGEYKGAVPFIPMDSAVFDGSAIKILAEKNYGEMTTEEIAEWTANIKDWIKSNYDVADQRVNDCIADLPSDYRQEYVRGAVSFTENINMKTWYSYDELGRVTWMARMPKALGKTFATKYEYDFLGNVTQVFTALYIGGNAVNAFYHHYEYDKDKRLSKAYTSLDGTNKKLRAHYDYYLHGPLKRIELGDKLQGIDFVYNIQGWLTQINHPDTGQDPGNDGAANGFKKDVFGMVLDYYESDLTSLFTTAATHDLKRLHHLPFGEEQALAVHQPLIRFNNFEPGTLNLEPGPSNFEPTFGKPTAGELRTLRAFSAENPIYKEMVKQLQSTDK